MKHYVICDKRADFIHDVKMRALLDEQDCTITEITDPAGYRERGKAFPDQFLIVCENMLESLPGDFVKQNKTSHVFGYSITAAGREKFEERNIPFLGKINSSSQLLSMLVGMPDGRADENPGDDLPEEASGKSAESREMDIETGNDFSSWKESIHTGKTYKQTEGSGEGERSRVETILSLRDERVRKETELLSVKEETTRYREEAVVVAIASTKGGVGKTTIATQLSCCLALTSYGRGRFQTCLVDFDTSFGDVCTSLDCDMNGVNIVTWIKDIRLRVKNGEELQEICYQKDEIRAFLQQKEDTQLYVLLALQKHTESLDISSGELEVIMRNLKDYGGFDFVLYDTGNDLKDTTLLAMELADYVLLIVTQDISCAHCLDMMLYTLESVHFDMRKICLVINNIMSAKATGIAVSELEESFAYPCWAKIKHDPLVVRKNNYGSPVVFSAAHDMTKQLRNVVKQLSETEEILQPEEPKKTLWQKLFPKKGAR